VKKDYYPINECLQICINEHLELGEAVLHKRSGKYLTAIKTYLSIINKLDISYMLSELTKISNSTTAAAA
jgi:hypothetical protein